MAAPEIPIFLVTEIVKTMHFSASTFQVLKTFTANSQIIFFTFMGSLKFANLRFNFFMFFSRADFQSAKPKLWTLSP